MAIMMVGTPGSGKSYSAVELCIIPALDGGRPVRTNIPLRVEACKTRWPDADVACIDVRADGVWASIPGGALVVVDEVGALWPARQAPTDAGPAVEWLAMHRHRVGLVRGVEVATDVVLISQGSTDLAGWARSKIDRTYLLRKLDAVGGTSWYRCDWYQGWVDSRKPPQRQHIGGGRGSYKSEVYSLYQSHTKADAGVSAVAVHELRADGKRSIWSSWTMRLAGIGILGMGWAVWTFLSQGSSFFMGSTPQKPAPGAAATGAGRPPPPLHQCDRPFLWNALVPRGLPRWRRSSVHWPILRNWRTGGYGLSLGPGRTGPSLSSRPGGGIVGNWIGFSVVTRWRASGGARWTMGGGQPVPPGWLRICGRRWTRAQALRSLLIRRRRKRRNRRKWRKRREIYRCWGPRIFKGGPSNTPL